MDSCANAKDEISNVVKSAKANIDFNLFSNMKIVVENICRLRLKSSEKIWWMKPVAYRERDNNMHILL
jgi:hypothetical protein